jgi:hypothetical protein
MQKSGWESSGRFAGSCYPRRSMTKVTLHYDLARTLTEEDYANIAAVHSVYGMVRVQLAPSLDKITVDHDASRLMKKDVESALARYGIPLASPTFV